MVPMCYLSNGLGGRNMGPISTFYSGVGPDWTDYLEEIPTGSAGFVGGHSDGDFAVFEWASN
jgi:hypothetical protein